MRIDGYTCACCGEKHQGLPAVGFDAPAYWDPALRDEPNSLLNADLCIVSGEHYFVRAVLYVPVLDADEPFQWGVWISQSLANFERYRDHGDQPGRQLWEPSFGWFASDLPGYSESTLELKTMLIDQGPQLRPVVDLEPSPHPLSVEVREGITVDRVWELSHLATGGN